VEYQKWPGEEGVDISVCFYRAGRGHAAQRSQEQARSRGQQIIRAFVQLRRFLSAHTELARKLAQLESEIGAHDEQIQAIFNAIRQLMTRRSRASSSSRRLF
jgi:GrpB-like predicted nucleotidyltransferase (UPF0157 family)